VITALGGTPNGALGETVTPYRSMEALVRFDNPPEAAVFLWQSYEGDLERVIEAALAPGQIAVDVGANCGIVTLAMRAAVGPTGRVISVDPSPSACVRVQQQAALNQVDNIEVVCAALGAKQETTEYFRGRVGLGSLPNFDSDLTTDTRMKTKVTTVDHLVRARDIERVALLKIDTDGSECSVLEGAHSTLRQHCPVVACEVFAAGLRRQGRSPQEQGRLLHDAGYALLRPCFARGRRLLARPPAFEYFEPIEPDELFEDTAYNILALHRDEPSHLQLFNDLARQPVRSDARREGS
jgi:FkbM family methyltransferase